MIVVHRIVALGIAAAMLPGCGPGAASPPASAVSPTAPTSVVPAPSIRPAANFVGTATVVSRTGAGGCGWGTMTGDRRADVPWRVTRNGAAVLLEQDLNNWPTDHLPYEGRLDGNDFLALYDQGPDYLRSVCQFRGGELAGRFSDDGSSFEAVETLFWGAPETETRVVRRWIVERH
jgi:hypothetical protein